MEVKYKYGEGEPKKSLTKNYTWYCDTEKDWHYKNVDGEWVLVRKNNEYIESLEN